MQPADAEHNSTKKPNQPLRRVLNECQWQNLSLKIL